MKIAKIILVGFILAITCVNVYKSDMFGFRFGTVASKYYILEIDNQFHFYITLYDKDYDKPGTSYMHQDFGMIEYEVDFEYWKTAVQWTKMTIPDKYKQRSLKNFTASKYYSTGLE
jgi:hypothetical protein